MNCKTADLLWHISALQTSQEKEWFINEKFTNVIHAKISTTSVYRKEWQMDALLLAEKIKETKQNNNKKPCSKSPPQKPFLSGNFLMIPKP